MLKQKQYSKKSQNRAQKITVSLASVLGEPIETDFSANELRGLTKREVRDKLIEHNLDDSRDHLTAFRARQYQRDLTQKNRLFKKTTSVISGKEKIEYDSDDRILDDSELENLTALQFEYAEEARGGSL
jgi:hypothetical protein